MTRRPRDLWFLTAVAAAFTLVYVSTFRDGTLWGDDFAQYIQHASNLVAGRPYGELPYLYDAAHRKPQVYPPGFPLMLAAPYALFGAALTPMKVVVTVCFAAALVLVGILARDTLALRSRIVLLVLLGANPYFWNFKDVVLSDLPFLALVMAVLVLTERLARGDSTNPWRASLTAGALIGVAVAVRAHGIVLIPVFAGAILIARRRLPAPVAAGAALASALAVAVLASLPLLSTYRDIGESSLTHFVESLAFYAKCMALLWDTGSGAGPRAAMFAATSAIALVAMLSRIRQVPRARELFIAAYVVLLCAFGGWDGMRYLIPVYVLYLVYVLEGIEVLGRRWSPRAATALLVAFLVASGSVYAAKYRSIDLVSPLHTAQPGTLDLWRFLQSRVPDDAVIQFDRVRAGTLYSGKRGSEYLGSESDSETWARLARAGTTHLTFITPSDGAHWDAFLERHQRCMTPIFENAVARVYLLEPPAERAALGCS